MTIPLGIASSGYYSSGAPTPPGTPMMWFKGDAGITKGAAQSGNAVTQWNDQSGNGYHLTRANGTGCPSATSSDTLNGMQVVDFAAASQQWMDVTGTPADPSNGSYTVGVVMYKTAGNMGVTLTTADHWIFAWENNYNEVYTAMSTGGFGTNDALTAGWEIIVVRTTDGTGANATLQVNGASPSTYYDSWSPSHPINIEWFGGWNPYPQMKIAEFLLWNDAQTLSDVSSYLNSRWAVY